MDPGANRGRTHSDFTCKSGLRNAARAISFQRLPHSRIRNRAICDPSPLRLPVSVLAILRVIEICPERKVIWVAARRIVARMANHPARRYGALPKLERVSVSARAPMVQLKAAVPRRLPSPSPLPAFIRPFPVYVLQKSALVIPVDADGVVRIAERLPPHVVLPAPAAGGVPFAATGYFANSHASIMAPKIRECPRTEAHRLSGYNRFA